jgi:2-polyprenyl-3-methyl-5-hydroxy-6-metoxy-1,4-benzoquinol methylase
MKLLDKYLQNIRIKKAGRFIIAGSTVLDIGSDDGILFKKLKKIKFGVGIEPKQDRNTVANNYIILKGYFPETPLPIPKFDTITLLAVLEHIPDAEQKELALSCYEVLNDKGNVIITVPSPKVDFILSVLRRLSFIDGMSLEEHYGYRVEETEKIFSAPYFKLILHKKFQLGLNNIFVFEKIKLLNKES